LNFKTICFLAILLFSAFLLQLSAQSGFPRNYTRQEIEAVSGTAKQIDRLIEKTVYHSKLEGDQALADSLAIHSLELVSALDDNKTFTRCIENYFDCAEFVNYPSVNQEIFDALLNTGANHNMLRVDYYKALILFHSEKYEQALALADELEQTANQTNNAEILLEVYNLKARALMLIGITKKEAVRYEAYNYFLKAQEGYAERQDFVNLARINNEIANFFYFINKNDKGFEYCANAREAFGRSEGLDSLLYLDIEFQYLLLSANSGSDSLYAILEKWINYAEKRGYTKLKNDIFSIYRTSLVNSGNYAKLEQIYLGQFRDEYEHLKRTKNELFYRIKAYGFESKGQIDSADYYWSVALDAIQEQEMENKPERITNSFFRFSQYLLRTRRYNGALAWLDRAWQMADSLDSDFFRVRIAESYTTGYMALSDYKNALYWKTSMLELQYKIDRETNSDRIRIAEVENEARKRQEYLQAENKRKSRESFFFQIAFFLFLFLAGLAFYQFRLTRKEKQRSDELLLNILPEKTASELRKRGTTSAKRFDGVTILFADIVGFSKVAENMSPGQLVEMIDRYFKAFDEISGIYGLEKIKTIGDAYLAVGGLPDGNVATAKDTIEAALSMQRIVEKLNAELNKRIVLRIGINTGDVVAGVVGSKKFQFDIWGDAVNIAARMEQAGEPGKVNVSKSTYDLVKNDFSFTYRGKIEAKNKGALEMYFLDD
jgi:class 3 adenylate cyclase